MLQSALDSLSSTDLRLIRISPVYETEPRDFREQRWFLNLVAEVQTTLFPMQLLARILKVERKLGRRRVIPKGPRTIDIDILLYGNTAVNTMKLQIPHPRYAERRFVLAPLADLTPDLRDPVTRKTVRESLAAVKDQSMRRVDFTPAISVDATPAGVT
ncbi:MAG: 2-amino-4-hydroxy-6-hydroxymethyldihydropteridine diphosphokinase [Acidobacteriota bacterium]|nr:2-amino-4-hydroxy-6-hydroxymethyldihydropteridine diphosphokinase [Acidobacteriota bacterium]